MKKIISYIIPKSIIAFVVIGCLFLGYCQQFSMPGAGAKPDHITLTWSDDPCTTQTITWRTDTTFSNGAVEYALSDDTAHVKIMNAISTRYITNIGKQFIHSAVLKNLSPGKKYVYRVGSGNYRSNKYNFTTEAKDTKNFKFLIFGDSQSGDSAEANPDYSVFKKTIHNAFKSNPDAGFFINMGDLVEMGGYYSHWNEWFKATDSVVNYIPIMPVPGNHETYKNSRYETSSPFNFTGQFKVPQNGPDLLKGEVYSYDYGDVHFAVINSQTDEEPTINGIPLIDIEKPWLRNDLQKTKKKWKIVLFHKTPYYNKATRTNDRLKAALLPVIDSCHVDVVFNGHDHGISRTYPFNNDIIVDKPSKGTVYYITGRSGSKTYKDLSKKYWDAFFYNPVDQPVYVVVEVSGDGLTIKAFNQDNTLIDTYTINKATDEDFPKTIIPSKGSTRLVIFGNVVQEPLMPVVPVKINNEWYVPASSFAQFLGGYATQVSERELTINISSAILKNHIKTLLYIRDTSSKLLMISAYNISMQFGFTYKYNETSNMLIFSMENSD